jgi:hypothetical protein
VPVTGRDIRRMGAGGLIGEPARPQKSATRERPMPPGRPETSRLQVAEHLLEARAPQAQSRMRL